MLFVGADDSLNQRMTHHVATGEFDNRDPLYVAQDAVGLDQPRVAMGRKVHLRFVAGNHRF